MEAPGVESSRAMSVSIGLDRFRTALPSMTVKNSTAPHPSSSYSSPAAPRKTGHCATGTSTSTAGRKSVAVRLPASLIDKLPLRETPFTLRAELSLVPNERGYPLTLVFYSFDGLRGVSIDGWSARDEDDTAVSEHPFVIPAERTRRSTLSIIVTARESFRDFAFGVPAAPRVAAEDNSGAATGRLLEGPRMQRRYRIRRCATRLAPVADNRLRGARQVLAIVCVASGLERAEVEGVEAVAVERHRSRGRGVPAVP
ncbi:MAG TPA: hypothetical protein VN947_01815 [Polyangia bacterium]|nr:hypothetical protein [Polyangia bacterium]